jgi:glycosyltransferase involved in cell wall biosynthesis
MEPVSTIGFVVIGRNEGERLIACLDSIRAENPTSPVVYVDSGSTDQSCSEAEKRHAKVLHLDLSKPFTAARARNDGWRMLKSSEPEVEFVQFVDGDCILDPNWIATAYKYLIENPEFAIVAGRRKELYPEASVYNMLCDIEWNTPVGEAKAVGGDALVRLNAIDQINGYNDSVIAGEEPEMCVRLRRNNWKIFRHEALMTLHDANMHKFSQWWKRTRRCGFAYALGASIHGKAPEHHWVSETRRAVLWGIIIPVAALLSATAFAEALLLLLLPMVYGLQFLRLHIKNQSRYGSSWSFFTLIGKIPEALGICEFWYKRAFNKQFKIIEYK